jgi:hypothetical protein
MQDEFGLETLPLSLSPLSASESKKRQGTTSQPAENSLGDGFVIRARLQPGRKQRKMSLGFSVSVRTTEGTCNSWQS